MDILEQVIKLPDLKNLKNYLLVTFKGYIASKAEIDIYFLSLEFERWFYIGYQEAKDKINTLWHLFKDDLQPLYELVNPEMVSLELKETFEEARERKTKGANSEGSKDS